MSSVIIEKDDVLAFVYLYFNLLVAWLIQLSFVLVYNVHSCCALVLSEVQCCLYEGMCWSVMNECMMCVNAWCIYTVKPTWRHGTTSALTSLISILLWGEDHLHRAESVLQNCVMGRCANLHIHVQLHLPFYNEKVWTQLY